MRCDGEQLLEGSCAGEAELTLILAAARTAVDAMDSTLDIEASVLRLSDMAAVSPREAAVLIARGRVPKEDTCTRDTISHTTEFDQQEQEHLHALLQWEAGIACVSSLLLRSALHSESMQEVQSEGRKLMLLLLNDVHSCDGLVTVS